MSGSKSVPKKSALEVLSRHLVKLSYDGVATWDQAALKEALISFKEEIKAEVMAELRRSGV